MIGLFGDIVIPYTDLSFEFKKISDQEVSTGDLLNYEAFLVNGATLPIVIEILNSYAPVLGIKTTFEADKRLIKAGVKAILDEAAWQWLGDILNESPIMPSVVYAINSGIPPIVPVVCDIRPLPDVSVVKTIEPVPVEQRFVESVAPPLMNIFTGAVHDEPLLGPFKGKKTYNYPKVNKPKRPNKVNKTEPPSLFYPSQSTQEKPETNNNEIKIMKPSVGPIIKIPKIPMPKIPKLFNPKIKRRTKNRILNRFKDLEQINSAIPNYVELQDYNKTVIRAQPSRRLSKKRIAGLISDTSSHQLSQSYELKDLLVMVGILIVVFSLVGGTVYFVMYFGMGRWL